MLGSGKGTYQEEERDLRLKRGGCKRGDQNLLEPV